LVNTTPEVSSIVSVGLSALDEGIVNNGAGSISNSDFGKTAKIASNGKGAAATATIAIAGDNNDLRITAKTLGTQYNGVKVNFYQRRVQRRARHRDGGLHLRNQGPRVCDCAVTDRRIHRLAVLDGQHHHHAPTR
jgi:hypothetical protein